MTVRGRAPNSGTADDRERGQAVLLVVVVMLLMATIALAIVAIVGRTVTDSARARTAADAAALAGVVGGRGRAEALAAANGGRVVAYRDSDGVVEVTVVVGRSRARATASIELIDGDPADRNSGVGTYTPLRAG